MSMSYGNINDDSITFLNEENIQKFKKNKKMICPIDIKELKSMMDFGHLPIFTILPDTSSESEDYNRENENYIKDYKEKKIQIEREFKIPKEVDSDSEIEAEKKKLEKELKKHKIEELKFGKRRKVKKSEIPINHDVQMIDIDSLEEINNNLTVVENDEFNSIIRQKKKVPKSDDDFLTKQQNADLENRLPDQQNYYKLNEDQQRVELLKFKLENDSVFNKLMETMGIVCVEDLNVEEKKTQAFMSLIKMESERSTLSIVWSFMTEFGPNSQNRNASVKISDIPIRTRKHEEEYLRQAYPNTNDRECINGSKCEGNFIPNSVPIVNVEFLSLKDKIEFEISGKKPEIISACVMCQRKVIQYYWLCARGASSSEGIKYDVILQHYRNAINEPGEYIQDTCFKSSSDNKGIPYPVALHVRQYYTQVKRNGIFWWEQTGYISVRDYDVDGNPIFC